MKARVKIEEYKEAEISKREAVRIAIEIIQKATDLEVDGHIGCFLKQGNLMYSDLVGGGSHSWFEENVIRKATEQDIAALSIIAKIKEYANGKD
jgi:hypothetical protein